jgi:hypothetical protein
VSNGLIIMIMVYIRNWADRRVIQRVTLHQNDEINICVSLVFIILGPCTQNSTKQQIAL